MIELPDTRIDTILDDVVEDLAIFNASLVRIENMGGYYWMSIHANGAVHEFSITATKTGEPIVTLEDSTEHEDET